MGDGEVGDHLDEDKIAEDKIGEDKIGEDEERGGRRWLPPALTDCEWRS